MKSLRDLFWWRAMRRATVSVVIASITSCGGHESVVGPGTTPVVPALPVAGRLSAVFTTPNTDDGAIMASISGGGIDSVSVASGAARLVRVSYPSSSSARIIVFAKDGQSISSGALFNVWVRDVAQIASYTVSIDQVASRVTFGQVLTAGYAMRLSSP